jgi:ABC-2 type transport system ATP-binding protein
MTVPPAVQAIELVKSYGSVRALDGVDFSVAPGAFVGLLGPNGAGKSTLFRILSGLFAPDAGEVRLFGLGYRRSAPAILRRLGVVFQDRSVDLEMTVRANLRFHGRLFGLARPALDARIDELATQFGLTEHLARPVRAMSGGQQRRVEIARALLNHPELLLMDEPSAGLDAAARRGLVAHIRDLARAQDVAVLWATHLVDELDAADHVIVLMEGRVAAQGPPGRVAAAAGGASLTDAYVALTGQDAPEDAAATERALPGRVASV